MFAQVEEITNMAKRCKHIDLEQGGVDRISSLPSNVMDCIMKLMTLRDIVRTSILSRKWRYIWTDHPYLILDEKFSQDIRLKRQSTFQNDFINIVNEVLLQHHGTISEFFLDISFVDPLKYSDVNIWLMVLSRKGVRNLTVKNSYHSHPYKAPSHIFSCSELRILRLSNCVFKLPNAFEGFSKLNFFELYQVTLESSTSVFFTPLLSALWLSNCRGIRHFKISCPALHYLCLIGNDDLELSHFVNCKHIEVAYFIMSSAFEHRQWEGRIDLTKLLGSWPQLSELWLDGVSLKCLTAGRNLERLPFTPKKLRLLGLLNINFNLDEIACILYLLRSSLMLHQFFIGASKSVVKIDMKIQNHLKEGIGVNCILHQLRRVMIRDFKGSESEMFLAKFYWVVPHYLRKCLFKRTKNLI